MRSNIQLISKVDYDLDGIYELPVFLRHKIWFYLGKYEQYNYMFIFKKGNKRETPYYVKSKKFWEDYYSFNKMTSAIYNLDGDLNQLYTENSFIFPKTQEVIIKEQNEKIIEDDASKIIRLFK